LQHESSNITLKSWSQSWLILKRLCLRSSIKTTFSINGDELTLMLHIPIILPLSHLWRWRCHYHDTLIGLQNYWYSKSCALSNRYQDTTAPYVLEACVYLHQIMKLLILIPIFSWLLWLSTSNPNMIIISIYTIKIKFS